MVTKTKRFDCVAMKNRIQAKLMEEYEARKGEFGSYAEFIAASANEHEWCRRQLARIGRTSASA
jgi:hypothetical protein